MDQAEPIPGFYAPVHRALTEPILLGGAPRAVARTKKAKAHAVVKRSRRRFSIRTLLLG